MCQDRKVSHSLLATGTGRVRMGGRNREGSEKGEMEEGVVRLDGVGGGGGGE